MNVSFPHQEPAIDPPKEDDVSYNVELTNAEIGDLLDALARAIDDLDYHTDEHPNDFDDSDIPAAKQTIQRWGLLIDKLITT